MEVIPPAGASTAELDEWKHVDKHTEIRTVVLPKGWCIRQVRFKTPPPPGKRSASDELKARFTAPIVCMCGSTRFKSTWIEENKRLTNEGEIVLSVGQFMLPAEQANNAELKQKLDDLHKRKIDLCDWVWVLDVNGYIGESTRSEIEYAKKIGRPIRYLSQEFPNYVEPPMET